MYDSTQTHTFFLSLSEELTAALVRLSVEVLSMSIALLLEWACHDLNEREREGEGERARD